VRSLVSKMVCTAVLCASALAFSPAAATTTVASGSIAALSTNFATPESMAFVGQGCQSSANVTTGVFHAVIDISHYQGQTITVTAGPAKSGTRSISVIAFKNCDPQAWFAQPVPASQNAEPGQNVSFVVGNQKALLLGLGSLTTVGGDYTVTAR
jgi:hypothetical protein